MDSILTSTKKLSNLGEAYDCYDADIIMFINNVFLTLKQLGIGPKEGFFIKGASETWDMFLPDNEVLREATKAYMGTKVRLKFDPPASSVLIEALNASVNEFEWRGNVEVETA